MVPAAPLPWVFSQTSRPDVVQAGVAVRPAWVAALGAAYAAAGSRAAAAASAPAASSRRAAVVRRFMISSPFESGSLDGSPVIVGVFVRAERAGRRLIHRAAAGGSAGQLSVRAWPFGA